MNECFLSFAQPTMFNGYCFIMDTAYWLVIVAVYEVPREYFHFVLHFLHAKYLGKLLESLLGKLIMK